MGWRGLAAAVAGRHTKRSCTEEKQPFFIEHIYVEEVKLNEKHVLDLLESIMKAPGLVKEELWLIVFKTGQFGSKIPKIRVSTFWIPTI